MANKLEVSLAAVNGSQDVAILTGKSSIHAYADGKRTGDTPTGTKYTVALQGNRLTTLSVKIDGSTDPLSSITDEQAEAACASMKPLFVRFSDCKISIYSIGGQMVMSAVASGVELVSTGK